MLNAAREERGQGVPLTEKERAQRHYEQYGTDELPPRGTGLSGIKGFGMPQLQSIGVLKQLNNPVDINTTDLLGLIGGGVTGWLISKKWPNMVIKYVGVVVGAELGILIARLVKR